MAIRDRFCNLLSSSGQIHLTGHSLGLSPYLREVHGLKPTNSPQSSRRTLLFSINLSFQRCDARETSTRPQKKSDGARRRGGGVSLLPVSSVRLRQDVSGLVRAVVAIICGHQQRTKSDCRFLSREADERASRG